MNITPKHIIAAFRKNQRRNGALKTVFSNHLFGKMSVVELDHLISNIEKEKQRRKDLEVLAKIAELESQGYTVTK